MIKVLHVLSSLDGGGVGNMLLNYYENIDREKFRFDFIVFSKNEGIKEAKIRELNSNIFHIVPFKINPIKYFFGVSKILKSNTYSIIHSHQNHKSFLVLFIALFYKIKVRIVHVRTFIKNESFFPLITRILFSFLTFSLANAFFSCSNASTNWFYPTRLIERNKVVLIKNATNLTRYSFSKSTRDIIRCKYNIVDSKIVIGYVARFSKGKNHTFLIRVFNEYLKNNVDSILWLFGEGKELSNIKRMVESLNLTAKVVFFGNKNNIHEYLNAIDLIVFPSKVEGFSNSLLEAQASGIPIICSDSVSSENSVTDLIKFLSLKSEEVQWARYMLKNFKYHTRIDYIKVLRDAGYDIKIEAQKLESEYMKMVKIYE